MPRHLTREELIAGLSEILASPKDDGTLQAIVVRSAHGERRDLASTATWRAPRSASRAASRAITGRRGAGNRPRRGNPILTSKSAS